MNQYNRQSSSNRRKSGTGNRPNSGRSEFMTVLLFYVLPFIVINGLIFILATAKPSAEITISESNDYITTTMELKVKSLLPIKKIELALDGNSLEPTKTGSKSYQVTLNSNGMLELKLTSLNLMKTIVYEPVSVLDDTPPTIKDNIIEDGVLSFRLEDTQSGVNYSSIFASDEDNPEILPLSIDRSTGLVTFEMQNENLVITAKDNIGNELHITFDPTGENVDPPASDGTDPAAAGELHETEQTIQ